MLPADSKRVWQDIGAMAILIAVCCILFFAHLGIGDLSGESEGNYAEIPREMLETGEWVIPQLNYVPYLEKPPLFYWLTAWTYRTIGVHAFAARLWSALPALFLVCCVFLFVRRVRGPSEALTSALILATSIGMIAMSRISYMDMLLCWCTAGVFLCFYLAEDSEEGWKKKLWFLGCFVSAALAVLTKGLIGLALPGLGIFIYLVIQNRWKTLRSIPWLLGLTVFFAITIPWHLYAGAKNDRFFWFYFVNEHWLRFQGKRLPRDYYRGAFYYQFLRVCLLFLPWTIFMPLVFIRKWSTLLCNRWNVFLLSWFGAFLIFYTLSRAKANYYMMAALPALAMLLAPVLFPPANKPPSALNKWAWRVIVGLLLLADIVFYCVLVFYPYSILKKLAPGSYPYLLSAVFLIALALLCGFLFTLRQKPRAAFVCLIAAMVAGSYPIFAKEQMLERRGSIAPMIELIEANETPQTTVVMRGMFERNSLLAFYLKKRFVIVSNQGDAGGDLDFGARFPASKPYFIQWANFLRHFGDNKKILYVTNRQADYDELLGNHPARCHLVGRVAGRLLIANYHPFYVGGPSRLRKRAGQNT